MNLSEEHFSKIIYTSCFSNTVGKPFFKNSRLLFHLLTLIITCLLLIPSSFKALPFPDNIGSTLLAMGKAIKNQEVCCLLNIIGSDGTLASRNGGCHCTEHNMYTYGINWKAPLLIFPYLDMNCCWKLGFVLQKMSKLKNSVRNILWQSRGH